MSDPTDLNTLSDLSNQKITTGENILEYFDKYVKSFTPYRDKPVYRAFIEFIIKNFVDIIYNIQPKDFKDLYEDQVITTSLIDLLLVSIGLPENLINTLTTATKLIIMKSFSDFERYKGTIKFVKTVGSNVNDNISYYELYTDFDPTLENPPGSYLVPIQKKYLPNNSYFLLDTPENDYYVWFNIDGKGKDPKLSDKFGIEIPINSRYDTNKSITQKIILELNLTNDFNVNINSNDLLEINLVKSGYCGGFNRGTTQLSYTMLVEPKDNGDWILRPKPIFIHPGMEQNTNTIRYEEAYNKIPNLLISVEQLNNLKRLNEIVLPIKTNILLLDYSSSISDNQLNKLFFTIIMDRIGDDYLTLYLSDESASTYTTTYKTLIYFWYFLIQLYYNTPLPNIQFNQYVVMGSVYSSNLTVEDIPKIEDEYNKAQTRDEILDFYKKYFIDEYSRPFSSIQNTISGMKETAKRLDPQLYKYINKRINDSEDQKYEIQLILDEIYASLTLSYRQYSSDPILYKYIHLVDSNITLISTDIKNTDSYKLIKELKPFHTDLLELSSNKFVIDDKFGALLMSVYVECLFTYTAVSAIHLNDQIVCKLPFDNQSSLSLASYIMPRWEFEDLRYPQYKDFDQRNIIDIKDDFKVNYYTPSGWDWFWHFNWGGGRPEREMILDLQDEVSFRLSGGESKIYNDKLSFDSIININMSPNIKSSLNLKDEFTITVSKQTGWDWFWHFNWDDRQ